jgi:tetratricopeptide (TPR) repeat protein
MSNPVRAFWHQLAPEDKKLVKITGIVCAVVLALSGAGFAVYSHLETSSQEASPQENKIEEILPDSNVAVDTQDSMRAEGQAQGPATVPPEPPKSDIDPFDAQSHRQLMRLDAQEYNYTSALEHAQRCQDYFQNDTAFQREYGAVLLRAGKPLDAAQVLQGALAQDTTVKVAYDLIFALFRSKQAPQALALAQALTGRFRENDSIWVAQAALLGEWPDTTRRKEALPLFQKIVRQFPESAEAHYQFSRYQMNRGNYRDAYTEAAKVAQKLPNDPRAHARLGMAAFYLKHDTEAEREYKAALALNPYDYNTAFNLGDLYASQANESFSPRVAKAKREAALKSYLRTLALDSTHTMAHFRVGVILNNNQQFREAIQHLDLALPGMTSQTPALQQLATSYLQLGDTARAIDYWNIVLEKDPFEKIAASELSKIKQNKQKPTPPTELR